MMSWDKLLISRRFSTVRMADRKVVLEKGEMLV
jgi:ABC-type multidrug transport system fused ATPase/permease subunit